MKNYKNYISLAILLVVMCGIIIAFTQVNKDNTLTTTPTNGNQQNTETKKEPFKYVNSKQSINKNIDFENNFGGTGKEEIFEVFKLNYFYIIGTSSSTNNYFENATQNSIYVLICDLNGNAKSVNLFEIENNCKILSCKIFRNKIYILIDYVGTKLITFDLSSNNFDVVFFDENSNSELIISSEPIVAIKNNAETRFYFVLSNKETTYPIPLKNIVMGCDYLNGTLLILNSNNDVIIGVLTTNEFNFITTLENTSVNTLNITSSNFVMIANQNNQTKLILLDLSFNICSTTTINAGSTYNLFEFKNQHYLTMITNNSLKLYSFCKHGTLTNEVNINENVTDYKLLVANNNFMFLIKSNDNFLNLSSYNSIGEQKNCIKILTNENFNITSFENYDSTSFMLIGTNNLTNQIISNNYGDKDIFVCKINTIN